MVVESKISRALRDPRLLIRAAVRRVLPNHPRLGYEWIRLADGSVTFQPSGFVAANSPANLLARHNYELACIDDMLAGSTIESSLEVGCGFGRMSHALAKYSFNHVGIDINEAALQSARLTYPTIEFQSGSATDIPLDDDSFDLVVAWTVLQHIPPARIGRATEEILRVLAPDGVLLICEETSEAGTIVNKQHCWHRSTETYESLLRPLKLVRSDPLGAIERLPGMSSPGTVMLWRRANPLGGDDPQTC